MQTAPRYWLLAVSEARLAKLETGVRTQDLGLVEAEDGDLVILYLQDQRKVAAIAAVEDETARITEALPADNLLDPAPILPYLRLTQMSPPEKWHQVMQKTCQRLATGDFEFIRLKLRQQKDG